MGSGLPRTGAAHWCPRWLQLWGREKWPQADVCTSGRQSHHLASSMEGALKALAEPKAVLALRKEGALGRQ